MPALTHQSECKNGAAIFWSCVAIIVTVAAFSRFVLLFAPSVATLNIAGPFLCVITIGFADRSSRLRLIWCVLFLIGAALTWLLAFLYNTNLYGDFRAIGSCLGLLVIVPYAVLIQRTGLRQTLNFLFFVSLAYTSLYLLFSFMVSRGISTPSSALNSAILYDPERGYRVYSCASTIGYAAFWIICTLKNRTNTLIALPAALIVFTAVYYQQSRVAASIYVIVLLATWFLNWRALSRLAYIGLVFYIISLTIFATSFDIIRNALYDLGDPSLALRLGSVDIARDIFEEYRFFGLGFPTNEEFHQDFLSFPYYPEDLGIMGLYASMGIAGAMLVSLIIFAIVRGVSKFILPDNFSQLLLVACGIYVILTSAFSISFYRGECSMLAALPLTLFLLPQASPARS